MKKKKMLIISIIANIVLICIIAFLIVYIDKKEIKEQPKNSEIPLEQIFETENIDESEIPIKKTNTDSEKIASKYKGDSDRVELNLVDADIVLDQRKGKLIGIRTQDIKANIFQLKDKVSSIEDVTSAMEAFISSSKKYLGIKNGEEPSDLKLYHAPISEKEKLVQESIFQDGGEFCMTYEKNNNKYNINFYKVNEELICELVRVF